MAGRLENLIWRLERAATTEVAFCAATVHWQGKRQLVRREHLGETAGDSSDKRGVGVATGDAIGEVTGSGGNSLE